MVEEVSGLSYTGKGLLMGHLVSLCTFMVLRFYGFGIPKEQVLRAHSVRPIDSSLYRLFGVQTKGILQTKVIQELVE